MSHHDHGCGRRAALPGVRLVIGPSPEPYEWSPDERYVAVSE
jgi:hypothetical protein